MHNTNNDHSSEFRFSADWISKLESLDHWQLYWKQQWLFQKVLQKGDSILEIGVGSGFTAAYLKSKSFKVKTLDIDEHKRPDIIQNIAVDPIKGQYDVVSAFEVFEHIPLKYLPTILENVNKTNLKYLLVSLPEYYPAIIALEGRLPLLKKISIRWKRPRFLPKLRLTDNHHWEVNMNNSTSIDSIKEYFRKAGFDLCLHELFLDKHFFLFGCEK